MTMPKDALLGHIGLLGMQKKTKKKGHTKSTKQILSAIGTKKVSEVNKK
jgi:hypothetical protein